MKHALVSVFCIASLAAAAALAQDNSSDVGKPDPLANLPAELPGPSTEAPSAAPPASEAPAPAPESEPSAENPPPPEVSPDAPANAESAPSEPAAPPEPSPDERPARRSRSARAAEAPVERNADEPDLNREQVFHQIYEKYNAAPTPLEAWEQVSGARQSEVYKVQKGDTLWDLSKTLFADPNYWPKVWSLNNDEVSNPHEIETWMQIRFFPGDLNEPPTVVVAESAPAPKTGEDAMLPPPRRSAPIIRKLPNSIPQYRVETVVTPAPDFQAVQPRPPLAAPDIALAYKVSEQPVDGVGEIKETELGLQTASEFQYVFVNVGDSPERIFTAVKDVGQIKDPRLPKGEGRAARMIEVQGEIEVVESVNDGRNLRRAIVRRNLSPIDVGARLVPGRIEMVGTADGETTPGPSARIIGAAMNEGRRLTDPGGFVFLDAGASAGLQEGMILPVQSNVRARVPLTGALINDRIVGHARIVRVTPNFSTAVLVRVNDDIVIGDTVGGAGQAAAVSLPPAPSAGEAPSDSELNFDDEPAAVPAAPEAAPAEGDDELTL